MMIVAEFTSKYVHLQMFRDTLQYCIVIYAEQKDTTLLAETVGSTSTLHVVKLTEATVLYIKPEFNHR